MAGRTLEAIVAAALGEKDLTIATLQWGIEARDYAISQLVARIQELEQARHGSTGTDTRTTAGAEGSA